MTNDPHQAAQRLVWRNTLFLVTAQFLVVPLSVITNILVARFLGPKDFGYLYLATTFATLAFLIVEFGQSGALAGLVAAQRSRSGELLGSALAWRAAALVPVALILFGLSRTLGHSHDFQIVLALMLLISALGTVSMACHDILRGYERTDIGAITFVGWKVLILVVTMAVLWRGGDLHVLLQAQAGCTAIGALVMLYMLRCVRAPKPTMRLQAVRELLIAGGPFLALALAITLQENVDAAFLAQFASAEAVGWHAAARKVIGLLIFPSSALIAALYPTLSRLRTQDQAQFISTTASALRVTVLLAVPLATGCALFPELGVWMFNGATFGPTADNLRILSLYLLLVYFSMPIGCALMASGHQRAWVVLQLGCVMVSVVLNPWLVPWSQSHFANGGLGVCIAIVLSEVVMVVGGSWLAFRALSTTLFDRMLWRCAAVALLGGAAMALIALLMRDYSAWLTAPAAVAAYGGVLAIGGLLRTTQLNQVRALFAGR